MANRDALNVLCENITPPPNANRYPANAPQNSTPKTYTSQMVQDIFNLSFDGSIGELMDSPSSGQNPCGPPQAPRSPAKSNSSYEGSLDGLMDSFAGGQTPCVPCAPPQSARSPDKSNSSYEGSLDGLMDSMREDPVPRPRPSVPQAKPQMRCACAPPASREAPPQPQQRQQFQKGPNANVDLPWRYRKGIRKAYATDDDDEIFDGLDDDKTIYGGLDSIELPELQALQAQNKSFLHNQYVQSLEASKLPDSPKSQGPKNCSELQALEAQNKSFLHNQYVIPQEASGLPDSPKSQGPRDCSELQAGEAQKKSFLHNQYARPQEASRLPKPPKPQKPIVNARAPSSPGGRNKTFLHSCYAPDESFEGSITELLDASEAGKKGYGRPKQLPSRSKGYFNDQYVLSNAQVTTKSAPLSRTQSAGSKILPEILTDIWQLDDEENSTIPINLTTFQANRRRRVMGEMQLANKTI